MHYLVLDIAEQTDPYFSTTLPNTDKEFIEQ